MGRKRIRRPVSLTADERRWLARKAALTGGSYVPVLRWLVLQGRLFERVTLDWLEAAGRHRQGRSLTSVSRSSARRRRRA